MSKGSRSNRSPATELSGQSPYPGPTSFGEQDHAFFFGRDAEIEELLDHVRARPLTVLHGKSGLGKTSLLQAGLFPSLRGHGFFPLRILFTFDVGARPLASQIRERMAAEIRAGELDARLPGADEAGGEESLWHYFQHAAFWDASGESVTPVLVLDQFEEVLQPDRRAALSALVVELADLVENWVPQVLVEKAGAGKMARPERLPKARVILSLREDYLADLDDLRPRMPSLGAPRMRLGALRWQSALDAVLKPAARCHLVEPPVAEKIVRVVAGEGQSTRAPEELEIESSLLALYCHELNHTRLERELPAITEKMVSPAERDKLLRQFYLRCIDKVSSATREMVEEDLLTGGRRDMIAQDTVEAKHGQDIKTLVDLHLLRREMRLGRQYVEIVHDVLVAPITACRNERREKERLAREEQQWEAQKKRRDEERRRRRWWLVAAGALVLGGVLYSRHREAEEQRSEETNRRQKSFERQRQAAHHLGERAAASLADDRWVDGARALAPALRLAPELWMNAEKKGLAINPGPDAAEQGSLLGLLARRFVASTGAGAVLVQDREGIEAIAMDDDGRFGAAVLADGRTVRLFDVDSPATERSARALSAEPSPPTLSRLGPGEVRAAGWFNGPVTELKISGDGKLVLAADKSGVVAVIRHEDGKRLSGFRTAAKSPSLKVDRTGRVVLLHNRTMEDDEAGSRVAVRLASDGSSVEKRLLLEPPRAPEKRRDSDRPTEARWALLRPSSDGDHVVGLWYDRESEQCQWRLWSLERGVALDPIGATVDGCAGDAEQSRGSDRFAVMLTNDTVEVWERTDEALERVETIFPRQNQVRWMSFGDENVLLVGGEKTLEGWAIQDAGEPLFQVSPGEAFSAAVLAPIIETPSGEVVHPREILVKTGDDIIVFDQDSRQPVRSFQLPRSYRPKIWRERAQGTREVYFRPATREAVVLTGDSVRLHRLSDDVGDAVRDHLVWGGEISAREVRPVPLAGIRQVRAARARSGVLGLWTEMGIFFVDGLDKANPVPTRWPTSGASLLSFTWVAQPGVTSAPASVMASAVVAAVDERRGLEIGSPRRSDGRLRIPGARTPDWEYNLILTLSEDGRWAGVGVGSSVHVWKRETTSHQWSWPTGTQAAEKKTEESTGKLAITALALTGDTTMPVAVIGDRMGDVHVVHGKGRSAAEIKHMVSGSPHGAEIEQAVWWGSSKFATGADDGTIAVWQVGERVSLQWTDKKDPTGSVSALSFTGDGVHLLSGDWNGRVRVWRVEGAREEERLVCSMEEHTWPVSEIELDPNGGRALSRDAMGNAILWDVGTCRPKRPIDGQVVYAGFAAGSIVTVARSGDVKLWTDDSTQEGARAERPVGTLRWGGMLADRLVAADERGGVFSWRDVGGGPRGEPVPMADGFATVATRVTLVASSESRLVALTREGDGLDWQAPFRQLATGKIAPLSNNALRAAALSRDGKRLLLVEEGPPEKKGLRAAAPALTARLVEGRLPDVKASDPVSLPTGHACGTDGPQVDGTEHAVIAAAVRDALRIVAVEPDGCVRSWDEKGNLSLESPSGMSAPALVIALSPAGDRLMVADAGRSVSFLEIKYDEAGNGYLRRIGWETDRHWATIRDIAFHPGGRLAVTVGDDAQAWLWDAQAGKALVRLGTHPGEIVWAAFDRTGDHVYTGGAETWIRRWDTRTSADDPDALLAAIYRWLPELSPDASAAPGPPAMEIRPYPKPRPSPARRTSAAP